MTRIFQIFLLLFVIFFLSFLNPKQANAASTCIYSDCFAIECFPACTASTCNQKVTCVGYCPSKGVYCLTDAGKCDPCKTFECKPKITSCPCSPSQCGGFSACQNDCGSTISTWCGACPTPTPAPTPEPPRRFRCSGIECIVDPNGPYTTCGPCAATPTPTPTPKPGITQTTQTCNSLGTGWISSNACVTNCTPSSAPPRCNAGKSCGSCGVECGVGVKQCRFTRDENGGTCDAPAGTEICSIICPPGNSCVANACIANSTISGNVFVDANKNRLKDAGEVNYTGAITITSTGGTVTTAAGTYTVSQLLSGSYTVSYTSLPTGYLLTYPIPPSFTVTVGTSCSVGSSNSASCTGGSIINLNFGITNSTPWIQCIGADCRFEKGFTSKVPSTAADGPYANLRGGGGTPGLIFSGDSSPDFGQGQASQNPYNWVVGGTVYPETFAPTKVGSVIKTSYAFLLAKTQRGNITPTDISAFCGLGGISNCSLSFPAGSHGVYIANGNLKVNGAGFPSNQNYVILVNGDLTISGKISVPLGSGSTAAFSASGNIYIDKNLGEPSASTATDIEGFYSADKSFIVQGTNDCAIGADLRFNVAGNIVVNAALSGGSFQNLRDLCAGNLQYPSFSVKERPDLILNSPEFLKQPNFTYQEIAP